MLQFKLTFGHCLCNMPRLDISANNNKISPNIKAKFGVIHTCFLQVASKRDIIARGTEMLLNCTAFVIRYCRICFKVRLNLKQFSANSEKVLHIEI